MIRIDRSSTRSRWGRIFAGAGVVALLVVLAVAIEARRDGAGGTPPAANAARVGDRGPLLTTCDPGAQAGCGADEKCDLFCGASGPQLGCRKSEGTLDIGATCVSSAATGESSCVKGAACLATPVGSYCLQLCGPDAPCPSGACTPIHVVLGCSADQSKNGPFTISVCRATL